MHRYTYRDAHKRARRLAKALPALGVKVDDRVGTLAWNGYRHFEIFYGISGIGAVIHTINPRLFPEQLVYIINHAENGAVVRPHLRAAGGEARAALKTVKGFVR